MKFKYGLNEIPPLGHLLLFGLQWLAIIIPIIPIIPIILIMGTAVTSLHPSGIVHQVVYIQKLFFVAPCVVGKEKGDFLFINIPKIFEKGRENFGGRGKYLVLMINNIKHSIET